MTYKKIGWIGLIVVIEECNKDGNMVGIEDRPMERIHYPAETSLTLGYAVDQKLRAIEGELGRPVTKARVGLPGETDRFPERER